MVTCLTIYKMKTINLTEVKINDIQLNEPFNENDYEINHHIKLDRYKFIMIKHKDLTVKVKINTKQ